MLPIKLPDTLALETTVQITLDELLYSAVKENIKGNVRICGGYSCKDCSCDYLYGITAPESVCNRITMYRRCRCGISYFYRGAWFAADMGLQATVDWVDGTRSTSHENILILKIQ